MRSSGTFQACLFFLRKGFERKKAPKRKANDFQLLKSFCEGKKFFVVYCLLNFVLLVSFSLWVSFYAQNLFVKKINKLEIVPITSFYYTTDLYPYHPTYREFICTLYFYFWSSVTISFLMQIFFNLFLFMIIWENLFFKSLWK